MKRKSQQNTQKSAKQEKAWHVARTIEIFKKVAADLLEGRTCEKEVCIETSSRKNRNGC